MLSRLFGCCFLDDGVLKRLLMFSVVCHFWIVERSNVLLVWMGVY